MKIIYIAIITFMLSGCISVSFNNAPPGTEPCVTGGVIGGTLGATAGGVAGYHLIGRGHGRLLGAIIGATAGGAGGAVIGDAICRAN